MAMQALATEGLGDLVVGGKGKEGSLSILLGLDSATACPGNQPLVLEADGPEHAEARVGRAISGPVAATAASLADGLGEEVQLLQEGAASNTEVALRFVVGAIVGGHPVEEVVEGPLGDVGRDGREVVDRGVVHADRKFF